MRSVCCDLCRMNFKEKYTKKSLIKTSLKVGMPFKCIECNYLLHNHRLELIQTVTDTGIKFASTNVLSDISELTQ